MKPCFDNIDKEINLGLDRIKSVMNAAGNPENRFYSVLIGGTNGKGSVAALLTLLMKEKDFRVGLYLSPHMGSVMERIRICGDPVEENLMIYMENEIDSLSEKIGIRLTPFERFTATAFLCFAEQGVDWVIAEVGMGGRLDATNILNAELSVITTVGLDHCEWLGSSIVQIAREKAGIVKEGKPAILGDLPKDAMDSVLAICEERGAEPHLYGESFYATVTKKSLDGVNFFYFSDRGSEITHPFTLQTIGEHFAKNAALALRAFEVLVENGVSYEEDVVRRALAKFHLPGRGEVVRFEDKVRVLDVAHNGEGMAALCEALKGLGLKEDPLVLFSFLKDKDWVKMGELLLNTFGCHNLMFLPLKVDRGLEWREFSKRFDVKRCSEREFERILLSCERPVVVCGCFAVVRRAINLLDNVRRR